MQLTTAQKVAIDQFSRQFSSSVYSAGSASGFATFIQEQILNPLENVPPATGISSALLSATAALKTDKASFGTINATTTVTKKLIAPCAGTITAFGFAVNTTVAANDTNYWTASAVNKGAAGTGTTALLAATDANTTKSTGGSALTAYVLRYFTLHGTSANLVVNKGDVIILTMTKTASGADLVEAEAILEVTPST